MRSVAQSEPEETGFAVIIADAQSGTTTTNYCDSLAEAVETANAGDTVAIMAAEQTNADAITIDKAITLDLGGFTLTSTAMISVEADLVITNGVIDIGNNVVKHVFQVADGKSAKITIANGATLQGNSTGNEFICIYGAGELNIYGTIIAGSEDSGIAVRGAGVTINAYDGCLVDASAGTYAVKFNKTATFNVYGGEFISGGNESTQIYINKVGNATVLNLQGGKFRPAVGGGSIALNSEVTDTTPFVKKFTAENCKAKFWSIEKANSVAWKLADFVADGYGLKQITEGADAGYWEIVKAYNVEFAAVENGTLETSVTNNIVAGDSVTVYATPATGFKVKSITVDGVPLAEGVTTFEMPAKDVEIAAEFEADGPTDDEGGEVEKDNDGNYVVTPAAGENEVDIKNLPADDSKIIVKAKEVATVKGVPAERIVVKNSAGTIIQPGVFVGGDATGFSTALDGTKSVDVAGETIKVQPEIAATENDGDTDATPLAVGSNVAVGVKSIPGLTYTLKRAVELGTGFTALTTDGASLTAGAEQTRVELKDIAKPANKAFYVIGVEIK